MAVHDRNKDTARKLSGPPTIMQIRAFVVQRNGNRRKESQVVLAEWMTSLFSQKFHLQSIEILPKIVVGQLTSLRQKIMFIDTQLWTL